MEIIKNIEVPTGNILVVSGEKGKLECLSIGDYGKEHNVKADFLGISREINGVPNTKTMALSEKWVVTISTQYGCSMGCMFCDVPSVGRGLNATLNDLKWQVLEAIKLHPEIEATKRLNIHYARMGEPTFNRNVLEHAVSVRKDIYPLLNRSLVHPVVSTMLPKKNKHLMRFLQDWCEIKNDIYKGDAGLQFSINTTDESKRQKLFNNNSLTLKEVSKIGAYLPSPVGRKYALNIALVDGAEVNGEQMVELFSPDKFMCKITPIHKTTASENNSIRTCSGYKSFTPYSQCEKELKKAGFDVLVFVPSLDEDNGMITCGNAILSGKFPTSKYRII